MNFTHTDPKTGVTSHVFFAKKKPVTWTTYIGNREIVMRGDKIISDRVLPEGEAPSSPSSPPLFTRYLDSYGYL